MDHLVPDMIVWLLYGLSIISVFLGRKYWRLLLASSCVFALYLDRLSLIAFFASSVLLLLATLTKHLHSRYHFLMHSVVILGALAFALHLIPGFNNLLVLDKVISGPHSQPFTMYLNLDKPLVFFSLLLLMPSLLSSVSAQGITHAKFLILIVSFTSLFALAFAINLVKPELSLPQWWWLFAINNLLFTCVAEEAFFRGYLQTKLSNIWPKYGALVGILGASLFFGLAHFSGGLSFVLIASLAGVIYGLSFYWSGRLSVSILIHFAFNMTHLVFFTYPLAK